MTIRRAPSRRLMGIALAAALAVAGCATPDPDAQLARVAADTAGFTPAGLSAARTEADRRDRAAQVDALLSAPLGMNDAVQALLLGDASLQALIASHEATVASTRGAARPLDPVFSFERMRSGDALDIGRTLSIGLVDLLLWPQRASVAERRIEAQELRLAGQVVDRVTEVRQAWVRAVAAQAAEAYARQVQGSAEASAELARRMQAAGNFSRQDRARHQLFYAEAAAALATARQQATAAREALVRAIGLTDAQAARMVLPARLPELPPAPLEPGEAQRQAVASRIDLRLAAAQAQAAVREQGVQTLAAAASVDIGIKRDTAWDAGGRSTAHGWELGIALPVFGTAGLAREAMNARTRAAADRLEATARRAGSQLREDYAAYRTAWDVARHHERELVPLAATLAQENLLRYNGMLIGVFELLAGAREQVQAVRGALAAQESFWLADAALQATLVGRPAAQS